MKNIIKTLFIITIITVETSAQEIYGTWLIQKQYLNNVLVFNNPYMKYEFTYDGKWDVEVKQGYEAGDFIYIQYGVTFKIQNDNLIMVNPDPESESDYIYCKYSIEGELLTIWFTDILGKVKMVFKRLRTPEI
ncbi:MAG: hypothetical protein KAW56_00810 [Candidatus Marinimicrobia bacterium]|nr:hypothetical protein [Candidatus Neomarinimicrobiota bacterium]